MRLKHIGLGVISTLVALVVYYVFFGSSQLTHELKAEVDRELQTLQSHGFAIEAREAWSDKEHFEIVFDDTEKIADYLKRQGATLTKEESSALKGMRIGVDLTYMKESNSAISFDLYPTTLPDTFTQGELSDEEKEALAKIHALFDAKTFLIHVDINSMLNAFRGYMKDINETFGEEEEVTMQMKALEFDGEIKNGKITSVNQRLESFLIKAEDELFIELSDVRSHYRITGPTRYDMRTAYQIKHISLKETTKRSMMLHNVEAETITIMHSDLVDSEVRSKVETMVMSDENATDKVTDLALTIKISNFDIKAFEALQEADPTDQKKIDQSVQKIISRGISIEIPNFSAERLYTHHKEMDGFAINAKIDIDKNLDLAELQTNPMVGISAINADLNLSLSESLHTFISQQPQALIAMMMFQPKEENGEKVYHITLENGILTVNGVAMQ
ncbi:MAG: hypothetical protein ABXS91_02800 [Sulfurimonas sp.]